MSPIIPSKLRARFAWVCFTLILIILMNYYDKAMAQVLSLI